MELLFWISVAGVAYPYFGYPLVLWALGAVAGKTIAATDPETWPSLSLIIPVHNEAKRLAHKVANTEALDYPRDRLEVLFVSDGSTDDTVAVLRREARAGTDVIELPVRQGKAAALNAGLGRARHDIVVFSDASIELEPGALKALVRPFSDPTVGCVSGEDRIAGGGGEALYGRYELALRRLESAVHSIAGASGSFYGQRRALCQAFTEGQAPDFLSVLRTVAQGARAISEPTAIGAMSSVKSATQEFDRKVRTVIRGMTALFAHGRLLNPLVDARFAFILWSHKVLRWTSPFFLVSGFVASAFLASRPFYGIALAAQLALYGTALLALRGQGGLDRTMAGRIALYVASVHAAMLVAWIRYLRGTRQEIWAPSQR